MKPNKVTAKINLELKGIPRDLSPVLEKYLYDFKTKIECILKLDRASVDIQYTKEGDNE